MLKSEVIKATPVLAGLTPEQITAIETLSANDENTVLASRIGEIYGGIDKDLLEASGIAKNSTEKTYDYVKRVAGELKSKAASVDTLNGQINSLTAEKTRLEKVISENTSDKEALKQLESVKAELATTKQQFIDLKTQADGMKTEHEQKLFGFRVQNELQAATAGLKFKKEFPEAVTKQLLANAMNNLKTGFKHEFIDDGKGGERMVFLDKEKGGRLNNPENQLNPFTASELLMKELKTMGILDEGRQQPGGGSKPGAGGSGAGGGTLDLSGAKSQVEAMNMASASLMQQGLTRGSKEYTKALDQAWTDYKVNELPEQA